MLLRRKWCYLIFSIIALIGVVLVAIYLPDNKHTAKADGSIIPDHYFAPYVDAGGNFQGQTGAANLADLAAKTGDKYFTLGFIVAGNGCTPQWGGSSITLGKDDGSLGQSGVVSANALAEIADLRRAGGDVIISFGGADGTELAGACGNVQALEQAYKSVVDHYNVDHLDFDIEGAMSLDHAQDDMRSQAIAQLQQDEQKTGKTLSISLTLSSEPTGLITSPNGDDLYVAQSAINHGVDVNKFNLMTMYYQGYCNSPCDMGKAATQSASALAQQLMSLYQQHQQSANQGQINDKIGITPFIEPGMADTVATTLAQAQTILDYAKQNQLGMLSEWSIQYDNVQGYAFSKLFSSYNDAGSDNNHHSTAEPTAQPVEQMNVQPITSDNGNSANDTGIQAWTSDGHPLYNPGQKVVYQGNTYICLRQIWGQVGWEPTALDIQNNFWRQVGSDGK